MTASPEDSTVLARDTSAEVFPADTMPAENNGTGVSVPHDLATDVPAADTAPTVPRADVPQADTPATDGSPVDPLHAADIDRGAKPGDDTDDAALAAISATLDQLIADSRRYHERAERREKVIDGMHAELERLRRGERRGMLRPLLTEMCRLRDDLLRQADQLPADYDVTRASELLRSYADSIEIALSDNGVTAYQPEPGDPFEARMHRGIRRQGSDDPRMVGTVASVRRSGYLDLESNLPIAAAEVVVFTAPPDATPPPPRSEELNPAGAPEPDGGPILF